MGVRPASCSTRRRVDADLRESSRMPGRQARSISSDHDNEGETWSVRRSGPPACSRRRSNALSPESLSPGSRRSV